MGLNKFEPYPCVYHKASAERHWERLFDLFARNL